MGSVIDLGAISNYNRSLCTMIRKECVLIRTFPKAYVISWSQPLVTASINSLVLSVKLSNNHATELHSIASRA